jgi:hypothetical protein
MKFLGCFYSKQIYICSPLTGVTFEVLPFSSYALGPTMLPLLETFFGTYVVEQLSVALSLFFVCP